MMADAPAFASPRLDCIQARQEHLFAKPVKRINDGDDLNFFLASAAYRDLTTWLLQLNRAMFPVRLENGIVQSWSLQDDAAKASSESTEALRKLLHDLGDLIKDAPPETGPRRFGNVAFRTWFQLAEAKIPALLATYTDSYLPWSDGDQKVTLTGELQSYLLGSFGSAQRLDYGTGHELSFLAFLAGLWKLGAFDATAESGLSERAIVFGVVQPYLELVRHLIMTYNLEPAGSHGVWGLDDHSFAPYIFGSAQLGPALVSPNQPTPTEGSLDEAPEPSSVTSKAMVADCKNTNMYFSAIQFIYDVKTGPFWEHSPILFDISGIKDGWGKINKGMLKMYVAEVLGKFPVVQHFRFGSLFAWEGDPSAVMTSNTVHAQQQPKSKDVPLPATRMPSATTQAPWAKPQMQTATGVPTTRAPWAAASGRRSERQMPTSTHPTNPRDAHPSAASGMAPTQAPWAKR